MPAPVAFTITIASLPPGFEGDPQALATAIAERLTVTPSEPWSSFVNGGAQPASNVGPFLLDGMEWKVWSDGLGTYTFLRVDGQGLIQATVDKDALADDTPNTALIFNASGRPALVSGTAGQVLTMPASGAPEFANAATANYFSIGVTTDQPYVSDGSNKVVHFDLVNAASGVTPDTANYRVPVTAGSVWLLGVSLQIAQINGSHADVQHFVAIRPYQTDSLSFGSTDGFVTPQPRNGVQTQGIYVFPSAGHVDVAIASTADTSASNFAVESNGINTRFYGFRLK